MYTDEQLLKLEAEEFLYRNSKLYRYIYNQALDDFVKFANTMPTVEIEDGEIRPLWLGEMAEQLKIKFMEKNKKGSAEE